MKTHRIVLPRDQHVAALAGVDRLLLPLDHAAKARFSEADGLVIKAADYFTGAPERGLAWYWKKRGCWNSTEPFFPLYKPGDRLALLEPWMRRLPLICCTCFYRVLAVVRPRLWDQDASGKSVAAGVVGAWMWDVRVEAWAKRGNAVKVEQEGECHT